MDKEQIRHFMTYLDYYRFVGSESKSLDEVQDYMLGMKKNRSTIIHHLQELKKNPGLFRISGSRISIDQKKFWEKMGELREIFGIPPDAVDESVGVDIRELKDQIQDLKNQLEKEKADRVLDRMQGKVLLTPSIEVGPLQDPTGEFFLDDPVYDLNPEDYKSFFGGVIDSYLEPAAEQKPEKELTVGNYQKKGLLQILTDRFLRKRRADETIEAELSPTVAVLIYNHSYDRIETLQGELLLDVYGNIREMNSFAEQVKQAEQKYHLLNCCSFSECLSDTAISYFDQWYASRHQQAQYETPRSASNNSRSEYFSGCNNRESLKKRYYQLSKIYHPDANGGSREIFEKITAEYQNLQRMYA